MVLSNIKMDSLDDLNDLGDLHDSVTTVRPTDDFGPMLQWLNGQPAVLHPLTDKEESVKTEAIGFFIACDKYPDLDEIMQKRYVRRYTIQYKTIDKNTGRPNKSDSWHVSPCSIFPLTHGVLSIKNMERDPKRIGLAFGREKDKNDDGTIKHNEDGQEMDHPKLMLKVLVHELVKEGYDRPLTISLRGMIVFEMISALRHHLRAVDFYTGYLHAQRQQRVEQAKQSVQERKMRLQDYEMLARQPIPECPFVGLSTTLFPAEEQKWVGKKKKSPIYPIMAQVPSHLTTDYLRQHRISKELLQKVMEPGGFLEQCVPWSIEQSKRIAEGKALTSWENIITEVQSVEQNEDSDVIDADTLVEQPISPPRNKQEEELMRIKAGFQKLYPEFTAQNPDWWPYIVRQVLQWPDEHPVSDLDMSQIARLHGSLVATQREFEAQRRGKQ